MARIELWMTVFAGLSGGLAGVLWSGLVTTPWLGRDRDPGEVEAETASRVLAGAALRAAAGAALGFLFWLGWGLIALVGTPWYAVGLAVRRAHLGGASSHPRSARSRCAATVRRARSLRTPWSGCSPASTIGLLCALAWHRYA